MRMGKTYKKPGGLKSFVASAVTLSDGGDHLQNLEINLELDDIVPNSSLAESTCIIEAVTEKNMRDETSLRGDWV
jgi:hypothetical protein